VIKTLFILISLILLPAMLPACSDPCDKLLKKACQCSPLECDRYRVSLNLQRKLPRVGRKNLGKLIKERCKKLVKAYTCKPPRPKR